MKSAIETCKLGDLPPGTRYLSADGETEYIVTDEEPDEGHSYVVNLRSGMLERVSNSLRLAVLVNGKLRVIP